MGELDEEMVYESRAGEVFVLGSTSWLIEDITHDRVLVSPAPGQPGKMPFWHGDAPGRPIELGRAIGAFVRELTQRDGPARIERLRAAGIDELAAGNLSRYLDEQRAVTGALPDDQTIVIERFRDELGDWRICIHSFFGARVHAPWAQAIEARIRERLGLEAQCIYTDDGIVLRVPEADEAPPSDSIIFEPEEIDDVVVGEVGSSSMFAGRFRECAARALLLPRRRPGFRQPLWQQRQKSAHLLQAASKYPAFPIVLETYRECLQDVFDLPALKELMNGVARREVRVVEVDTPHPSPFAGSLTFGFISAFMYEGDSPLAERRAQGLSLDRSLLYELLGREELRELIDENALGRVELELQLLTDERKLRDREDLQDALRVLGDLSSDEIRARAVDPDAAVAWSEELAGARRAVRVRIAGVERWIAIEDAARVRDALGVPLPMGIASAFLEPVTDPLGDLVARYARRHGPFHAVDPARRLGLGVAVVEQTLQRLRADGRVVAGEFRPGGTPGTVEWVDSEVLRRLRRASLAAFRKEIEAVSQDSLARFAVEWHGVGRGPRFQGDVDRLDALYRVIEQLGGAPLPASQLESMILPGRVPGYSPALLDQLCASGEVVWAGAGAAGRDDGWIVLTPAADVQLLVPDRDEVELSPLAERALKALGGRGAMFFRSIAEEAGALDDRELVAALWELVWAGIVTNDTFAPLRATTGSSSLASSHGRHPRRRRPSFPARLGPPAGAGRWSLLPDRETQSTRRLHRSAEQLLARHGVLTRPAASSERIPGGFAAVYPVLRAMEEAGRCRRGYFVEGLGGAQFALSGAVDRMRGLGDATTGAGIVLAAGDPANPYGAALPWPTGPEDRHRPGRKAGAAVVLVDGRLALYVEKGGRSLLTYGEEESIGTAMDSLADATRAGVLGSLHVQRIDGEPLGDTEVERLMTSAGFRVTSRGLRLSPGG